jgi:prolyl-tRNA synthetase
VEQNHDEDGFWLPRSIAPFDVVLSPLSAADELMDGAIAIAADLERAGFDVLLDDRDERPGVKFKDADLIGVPYRITMGSKKFAEGKVEVLVRHTKERADVDIAGILEHMQQTARS